MPTPPSHSTVHDDAALPPNNTPPNNTPPQEDAREIRRSTDNTVLDTGACSEQLSTTGFLLSAEDTSDNECDDCLQKVLETGCSVSLIKDYVSELTDRSLQRKLRDVSRNQDFCHAFTSDDNPDTVVCESDDVVFQFSWCSDSDNPTDFFWLAKRDTSQMTHEERVIHRKLLLWAPADRERIKNRIDAGLGVLHVVINAIRFFLG
eukprot:TRINITY_DN28731_c0_g2_i7.p1 TRINITY_DN28731_c0_g2~~TRINITY_DN28731_c0_g2_i7.p1  ORF type:complete len:205 (+),score=35.32 TRINITY_DN28731_c0_g2_i7:448-1062(+)